jgi:hypothetical protein
MKGIPGGFIGLGPFSHIHLPQEQRQHGAVLKLGQVSRIGTSDWSTCRSGPANLTEKRDHSMMHPPASSQPSLLDDEHEGDEIMAQLQICLEGNVMSKNRKGASGLPR